MNDRRGKWAKWRIRTIGGLFVFFFVITSARAFFLQVVKKDQLVKLAERQHQKAGTLSGGEQQMCAIGRALMARPKLLMLDEPSMGLAPIFVQRIFETIIEVNKQGMSILLVEQNALMALEVAGRGYVLETGRVKLADDAKALAQNDEVKKTYLGEV